MEALYEKGLETDAKKGRGFSAPLPKRSKNYLDELDEGTTG